MMNARKGELLCHSLVALAAGGIEVGVIDGRAGIARRQNVMHAVATGAVGRNHRAAFRGQSVIAIHVGGDAVARDAEFLESRTPSWQRAQVSRERFCSETGELGSLCDLMEWMPWQSVQTGDSWLPRAMA